MDTRTALTFVALAAIAPATRAGGVEHFCNASGTEVVEAWSPAISGAVPWTVNTGPAATKISPGFPGIGCSFALDPNVLTHPGMQSINAAVQAWNNAALSTTDVSTFAFDPSPLFMGFNIWQLQDSFLLSNIGNDGQNLITMWEPSWVFDPLGGPFTLAMAPVSVNLTTAQILEADVAVNVRGEATVFSGIPHWSFVEENALWGLTFVTHPDAGVFANPTQGYADLQGVVTHELGHVAGLGHSMIDSIADGTLSRFPVMFPFAQGEPFLATAMQSNANCNPATWTTHTVTGSGLPAEGMLGRSARNLRRDDLSAIGQAYPTAAFGTNLGSIVGTVVDFAGNPVLGASVVAFAKDRPDTSRHGTLSFGGGAFSIEGLQAGNYLLYVEPVDQNPAGPFPQPTVGHYFDQAVVPNFVFLGFTGCITAPNFHPFEFWDANESSAEASATTASTITVVAGAATTANFVVNSDLDLLTVRDQAVTTNFRSPRGVISVASGGAHPSFELRIEDPTRPNQPFELYFGVARTGRIVQGQCVHVISSTASGLPGTVTGTLDALGRATFVYQPTSAQRFLNVFVQARTGTVAGGLEYSNPLNVWVTN